jgi:hypothetical protein
MAYASAGATFAESEARIELARALLARAQPIADSPAELYLTKTRKIPADAVRACEDLRYLPSPIEGRHMTDHALVSLLRDAAGEVCGLQLEYCDIAGARTAGEPSKQAFALRKSGCRDGLFYAGGEGDVAFLTEGYSSKALAVASLGIGKVYGGGGLNVLGFAVPPERRVVIVPDRAPESTAWSADGAERLADQHAAAYARAVDRLILAGREVEVAAAPDCTLHKECKDADAYLRRHGAIRLKELLQRTVPGELSRQGQITRLARIKNELDRAAEVKKAAETIEVLRGIPIAQIREAVEAERTKARAAAPEPETLNQDQLAAAAADIIGSTDVLGMFARSLQPVVAGEERNAKVLYLACTSRLFPKVMSVAIKGPSGVGKSELRRRVLEYLPTEDVVSFTTTSEKALLYYEEDFCHRILSMGEAAGVEEQSLQEYLLRELISEGRLRYPVVQKIGNEMVTVTVEKNGPVVFLVTTTKHSIDPEVETRLLSLEIDDSAEQTRRVLQKVATVEGGAAPEDEADLERWRNFQRWLRGGDTDVSVPFANALADLVSTRAVRLRRDFGQFLRAVKAHALLHRQHRERNADGLIVADIRRDYGPVRGLLADVIAHTAGLSASPAIEETVKAVRDLTATTGGGVTAIQVGKQLKLDKSAARRRLLAAVAEGHLVNQETRRGQPGRYVVSTTAPEGAQLLPTIEELHEAVYPPPPPPPNPVPPCHRSQKTEKEQEDSGGKTGGNGLATADHPRATAGDGGEDRWQPEAPVASDVPPSVPPVSVCDGQGNGDRWHGGTDSEGVAEGGIPGGNGADGDAEAARVIAEVEAGDRCGGCLAEFKGEDAELIGTRWYHHTEQCAGAARAKAAPPSKRRSRIKRPERPA